MHSFDNNIKCRINTALKVVTSKHLQNILEYVFYLLLGATMRVAHLMLNLRHTQIIASQITIVTALTLSLITAVQINT